MLTAVTFLLILTVSVLIHELAHYLSAKSVGVSVRAFSVGMGPVLWRRQWRGTEWRLSLLPLGGYVDLPGLAAEPGEDGVLRYPEEGFSTKSLPKKLWVLVAGVLANFVLAVLLIAAVITIAPNSAIRMAATNTASEESGAVFEDVVPGSPAEALGIEPGDVVLELNGLKNPGRSDVQAAIREASRLELTLQRGSETITLGTDWPPSDAGERPMLGVALAPLEVETLPEVPFGKALLVTTGFLVRIVPEATREIAKGIGQTFVGQRNEGLVGPVGIIGLAGQATQGGLVAVLLFAGIINFSLAVFNLLPIPGLDGGRMLLAIVTALRGRPFRPGQEEFIHFLGFMAVLALIVLVTFRELSDLVK